MIACHAREVTDALRCGEVADAAALGVAVLAEVVTGAQEGITIVDAPEREREFVLGRFAEQVAGEPASFSGTLIDRDGAEREFVCSNTTVGIAGRPHGVAIFRDLTGPRGATRTAVGLAQAAAQLVGAGSNIGEVLAGIARQAVEGTRAVACGDLLLMDGAREQSNQPTSPEAETGGR